MQEGESKHSPNIWHISHILHVSIHPANTWLLGRLFGFHVECMYVCMYARISKLRNWIHLLTLLQLKLCLHKKTRYDNMCYFMICFLCVLCHVMIWYMTLCDMICVRIFMCGRINLLTRTTTWMLTYNRMMRRQNNKTRYVCAYLCEFVHICMYICMFDNMMFIYVYICMCKCIHVYIWVSSYICMLYIWCLCMFCRKIFHRENELLTRKMRSLRKNSITY